MGLMGTAFDKQLVAHVGEDEEDAAGFATSGCEDGLHEVYVVKDDMERLGFESVKSIKVKYKGKLERRCFMIHLCGCPQSRMPELPTWDESNFWKVFL